MAPYTGKLMPMVLRELRHESAANRRNAAFAAGVLVQAAPAATATHLPNLLQVSNLVHRSVHRAPSSSCHTSRLADYAVANSLRPWVLAIPEETSGGAHWEVPKVSICLG